MTFFFSAAALPVGKRDEREKEQVVMSLIRKKIPVSKPSADCVCG